LKDAYIYELGVKSLPGPACCVTKDGIDIC